MEFCEISVDFKPTESMLSSGKQAALEISYLINNETKKAVVILDGVAKAKAEIDPLQPEILVSFPKTTKNLVSKGTLTIINKSKTDPITDITIAGLPTKPDKVFIKNVLLERSIFNYTGFYASKR